MATVTGTPGQVYILQHFEQQRRLPASRGGPYWVSSVHAGAAEDSVDATAVIDRHAARLQERFLTAAAIPLDGHTAWSAPVQLPELSDPLPGGQGDRHAIG